MTVRPGQVQFAIADTHWRVTLPDPATARTVERLYPGYLTRDVAGSPTREILVRRDETGFQVAGPGATIRWAEAEFLEGFELWLTERFLDRATDYVHLHASGSVDRGRAVIAVGRSGAGKSSLAAAWCLGGRPVLGDDVIWLDADGVVRPFRRQFKLDPAVLRRLGGDPAATAFWEPGAEEVWFDPAAHATHAGWADPARVVTVAIARYRPGGSLRRRPVSSADALNALVHGGLDSGLRGRPMFDRLCDLVQRAQTVEIQFGDAAEAAEALWTSAPD